MCVLHWIETAGYAQNGCYILLLHRHSGLKTGMVTRRVECSNHFAHTQQFLSNAKRTLPPIQILNILLVYFNFWLTDWFLQYRFRYYGWQWVVYMMMSKAEKERLMP